MKERVRNSCEANFCKPNSCRPRYGTLAGLMLAFVILLAGRAWAVSPNVTKHTQNEIQEYLMNSGASVYDAVTYAITPVKDATTQTYIAGDMSAQSKQGALTMLNNIRYIAGLNPTVVLDSNFGTLAQAGAYADYVIDDLTHYPGDDGTKPEGMSDALWNQGIRGASSSNLAWGQRNLNAAVLGWMDDEDKNNIDRVGHRRWILNPSMGKTGFGAAGLYYAMYSFDGSGSGRQSYVVWPAQEMPIEYFRNTLPWTISVGQKITTSTSVKVTLTRQSDGQVWTFDSLTATPPSNKTASYFQINNEGYGAPGCIIFRPENISYQVGDSFHVKAENVNGNTIEYDVHFFKGFSVSSAEFGEEEYKIAHGSSKSMRYELKTKPSEASVDSITWKSSDESIFTVDENGSVKGIKSGSATLTATIDGKIEASCQIKILKSVSNTEDVKIERKSYAEYAGGLPVKSPLIPRDAETGEALVEGKDFEFRYMYTDATEPTITQVDEEDLAAICGIGDYAGSTSYMWYYVIAKNLTDEMVSLTPEELEYNGSEQHPAVTVKNGEVVMKEGEDYTLVFSGGTNLGDYTVTVQQAADTKNYTGIVRKTFKILPKKLTDEMISVSEEPLVYNGSAQQPQITVTDGETVLKEGTDYEIVVEADQSEEGTDGNAGTEGTGEAAGKTFAAINAGSYKYTVVGKGNYTSEVSGSFVIGQKPLTESMITVGELTYNGQEQEPAVTISDKAGAVGDGSGAAGGDAGSGSGDAGDVSGAAGSTEGKELITTEDYELSVSKVKDAGTYTVEVTGKRNYTGNLKAEFTVSPASLKEVEVQKIEDQTYSASAIEPEVILTFQGQTVPKDDYECTFSDNTHAGKATVKITPKKNEAGHTNFTEEAETAFTINPRSITKANVTLNPDTAVYNGKAQAVKVSISVPYETIVTDGGESSRVLSLGPDDFDLTYLDADGNETDLINVGNYSVKATGKGDFTGFVEAAFTITPKPITDEMVSSSVEKYVFNGTTQQPSVKVTDPESGLTLTEGKEYETSVDKDPVNAGSYVLTVKGKGNYDPESSVDVKFEIAPKQLTESMVTVGELTYNGQEQEPAVTISDKAGAAGDGSGAAGSVEGKELITVEDYELSVSKVKDAGTYSVEVTGKRNYTGNLKAEFTVSPASLKEVVAQKIADQTYSGSAIEPEVVLTFLGQTVPKDDYECTFSDNTHAGTASVKIAPKKNEAGYINFTDEAGTEFVINPRSITNARMTLDPDTAVYNGKAQTTKVSISVPGETIVTDGGTSAKVLALGTDDYDLTYLDADGNKTELINVGNYSVKATAKGDFTGSVEAAFTITPKPITKEMVETSAEKFVFNGTVQQPSVKVTDLESGLALTEGTDYETSVDKKPVNADKYVLTVKGKGNYDPESSVDVKFEIEPKQLTESMVTVGELTYNCKEQEPTVTVSDKAGAAGEGSGAAGGNAGAAGEGSSAAGGDAGDAGEGSGAAGGDAGDAGAGSGAAGAGDVDGKDLITAEDYELSVPKVKDVDTYAVTVTGKRNYTGKLSVKFTMLPASLKDVVAAAIKNQTYTGEPIIPTVNLTYEDTDVPVDDFSCEYSDNINVGTASVLIKSRKNRAGHTNFTDETKTAFNIIPMDITGASVTLKPDTAVYDGSVKNVTVTVMLNGSAGKALGAENYDISYLNADGEATELKDAGSYSVKVTAKGNYTGTAEAAFVITPKPISTCKISLAEETLIFNGESQLPAVTAMDGEQELKEGKDFTVSADYEAVNVGTYKVTVTGIDGGNYAGDAAGGSFTIVSRTITEDMIDEIPQQDADAAEQAEPALTIRLGKMELTAGKDYTVAYENNASVGDAAAVVTGQGNFTGTVSKGFRICQSIEKAVVVPEVLKYTEDGSEKKPGVTVTLGETVLEEGKDYTVSYKNNVKPGTAQVIVTGAGYYMGSASAQFTIEAKPQPATGGDGVTEPLNPEVAPTVQEVEAKVTTMADNAEIPGSGYAILQANAKKIGKDYVKLGWNRVKGAEGYILYGNRCGRKFKMQKIATFAGGGRTSFKVTKLADGKTKLKKGTYYKFVVVAYARDSLGREKIIASSKSVHFMTNGHKKYTNYTGVKVSKGKISIKKGKSIKVTAKALVPAGKKVSAHRKLQCESADPASVKATCNKAGTVVTIKGLKKTKKPVIIYVYAQSGKCAKIKVTVK